MCSRRHAYKLAAARALSASTRVSRRQLPGDAVLVSAESPDGSSARVHLSADWHPPLVSLFVPDGVRLDATGTSRTALR